MTLWEIKCINCNGVFREIDSKKVWWNYMGSEDVKVAECPYCKKIVPIKYETRNNLNYDKRYYSYDK